MTSAVPFMVRCKLPAAVPSRCPASNMAFSPPHEILIMLCRRSAHHADTECHREYPVPEHRDPWIELSAGATCHPSRNAIKEAMPTVKTGTRMCHPISQANWNRNRGTGSRSMTTSRNQVRTADLDPGWIGRADLSLPHYKQRPRGADRSMRERWAVEW